jgi:hypothetical protein
MTLNKKKIGPFGKSWEEDWKDIIDPNYWKPIYGENPISETKAATPSPSASSSAALTHTHSPYIKVKASASASPSQPPPPDIDPAQEGFIKVISNGPDDITLINDKGDIVEIPILNAKWEISPGELPKLTLEIPAELEADGCVPEVNPTKQKGTKKTVPIKDFIEGKNEDNNSRQ